MNYAFLINGYGVTHNKHNKYKLLVDKILSELYTDRIYLAGFFYFKSQPFDTKKSDISILNKAIGNITIIKWMFKEFKFKSFDELMKFVKENKLRLFKSDGLYFNDILNILKISERKGIKNEKKALKYIKSYLIEKNIEFKIRRTPICSKEDVIFGIDIIITIDKKDFYVQVKPLVSYTVVDGEYEIISSGKIKKYKNIHYYIFVNDTERLLLSNESLKVRDGIVYAPTKALK